MAKNHFILVEHWKGQMDKIPVIEEEKGIHYTEESIEMLIEKINEIIDWINSQS